MTEIVYSKKGVPCIWEEGGFSPENGKGFSTIVAGKSFNKKQAIFISRGRNGKHALIPIEVNDFIIKVETVLSSSGNYVIDSMSIERITRDGNSNSYNFDCDETEITFGYKKEAIRAAIDKAKYINCDKFFYAFYQRKR